MNVAAHQDKKNENISKREAGEERKRSTDLKKAACCPSAVVQRRWREGKVNVAKLHDRMHPRCYYTVSSK